jgi:hypothetical protein
VGEGLTGMPPALMAARGFPVTNRTELPLPAAAADGNIRRRAGVTDAWAPRVAEVSVPPLLLCSAGLAVVVVVVGFGSSDVACEARGGDAWISSSPAAGG